MAKIRYKVIGNTLMPETDASLVRIGGKSLSEYLGEGSATYENTIIVGTGGDYADIKSALDSITDNSATNRYLVIVKNGTYDITGTTTYLGFKNYVTIQGESRDGVIVRNSVTGHDDNYSVFDPSYYNEQIEYARICNMTLSIKNGKCCVHIDNSSRITIGGVIELDGLRLIHEKEDTLFTAYCGGVNCGLHDGQRVHITNCIGNVLAYCHTTVNPLSSQHPNTFKVVNCKFAWIGAFDISAKNKNYFIAHDNTCDYIGVGVSNNATDKLHQSFEFDFKNNKIDRIFFIDGNVGWFDKYPFVECVHRIVNNRGNVNITKGTFVSANDNAYNYASFDYNDNPVIPYDANKPLFGLALEDINAGNCGVIQVSGVIVITSSTFAYGDWVTLNSSGNPVVGTQSNAIGRVQNKIGNNTYIRLLNNVI